MPPERPEGVWGEIERLRDWRHDEAVPALASLRGRLQALEVRMADIEPRVERMAKAQEIADAVADRMHERRGEWLSGWQKLAGGLVGLAAVADFVRGIIMS